eukprot:TRINITY_DN8307_c0_g1_i1.p3 TRINITY_DN8307_c0_g1~~TRINITY_DN8307_c0_g1_i1.p3  ORF type:complete len:239 (-),score=38.90 TRINITY_DN8307_c0_g1_i1:1509-2225(-)
MAANDKQPVLVRVKFNVNRVGDYLMGEIPEKLHPLLDLMEEMEEQGALPILIDGRVCGNCGFTREFLYRQSQKENQQDEGVYYVTRSGKTPNQRMTGDDFVEVVKFNRDSWSANFKSSLADAKPTSDLPLYDLMFRPSYIKQYGWGKIPKIAIHGHALADGKVAKRIGLPISDHFAVVSTAEDTDEVEKLFMQYSYPENKCFIRKGHGFFVLGDTVEEVKETFEKLIQPYLADDEPVH